MYINKLRNINVISAAISLPLLNPFRFERFLLVSWQVAC